MEELKTDIERLEAAMRLLFQTMKRPQTWTAITARAGVTIDRPAATLLQLLVANREGQCRVHDVALQLGIEAPSVTRKTQQLEQGGYLTRERSREDRRSVGLSITAKGKQLADRLRIAQRETISQVLSQWSTTDRQRFIELFERYSADVANQTSLPKTNKQTERIVAHGHIN